MQNRRLALFLVFLIIPITFGYLISKMLAAKDAVSVLHTYSVPIGRAEEIKSTLNHVFSTEKNDSAAQAFGDGLLVVKAPESYQRGIANLIDRLLAQKVGPASSIRLDYWFLQAESAAQTNAGEFGGLTAVLETIAKQQGKRKFSLLEHLNLTILNRREAHIKGTIAEITTSLSEVGDRIEMLADIRTREHYGEIKSDFMIKPGEYVVLGQNILRTNADAIAKGEVAPEELSHQKEGFHIIRAEILP